MMPDFYTWTTNTWTTNSWEIAMPPAIKTQKDVDEAYCKGYNEGYERCKEINGYQEQGITGGKRVNITLVCEVCPACNHLTALANYCSWCGAKQLP